MKWRFLRRLVTGAFVVLASLAVLGTAFFLHLREEVELMYAGEIAGMDGYRPPLTVEVFDRRGRKIDSFATERRLWVPLTELPPHVWQAFLAAEDRRFLDHFGVDPTAIARAAVRNFQAGSITEGGSTITQQLAKNLVTGADKTYDRKIREALVAMELERQLTKAQILELYLNQIYLGAGAYGVEAAARRYFQKPAAQLDPGQAAMIAGLIPAPSTYNPERNPERAAQRRREVLQAMVEAGWITARQAARYVDDPLRYDVAPPREPELGAAYRTMVRRELRRLFGGQRVFQEGLKVVTPYDEDVQRVAEQAVWDATAAVQQRHGHQGTADHIPKDQRENWIRSGAGLPKGDDEKPRDPVPGDCFQVLVDGSLNKLRAGEHTWSLKRSDRGVRVHRNLGRGGGTVAGQVRNGDLVNVCLPGEDEDDGIVLLDRTPWAEAGIVVVENRTGGIVALVGGKNDKLEGFVRATQARRQPGSTMKLYVYATALRLGHSQLDIVQDAPISFPGANGRIWAPRNYDGGFFGPLPYRVALAYSRNVPSVRITVEVTPQEVIKTSKMLGVESPLRADYTLALGSSEMTPMDQAMGFSTIARLGERRDPVYILELRDMNDRLLGRPGDTVVLEDGHTVVLPGAPEQVMDPGVAYEMADMLAAVMKIGTGARARGFDHQRYGKTGTTNDFTDAWFVGFNTDYTAAVWVGTDTPNPLGDRETGSRTAMPAWAKVMDYLGTPSATEVPVPPEGVRIPHGGDFIGLARSNMSDARAGARIGSVPLGTFPAPRPGITAEGPLPADTSTPPAPQDPPPPLPDIPKNIHGLQPEAPPDEVPQPAEEPREEGTPETRRVRPRAIVPAVIEPERRPTIRPDEDEAKTRREKRQERRERRRQRRRSAD